MDNENELFIQPSSRDLISFLTESTSDKLTLDLNLAKCVASGSPFINFGTAAPTSTTPGCIYIQI